MSAAPEDGESYVDWINRILRPEDHFAYSALDLFAGCGGLALGFEATGFETIGFEMNPDACESYRSNLLGSCTETTLTPQFDFPQADIVIGGPPCQPFSVGGQQRGLSDSRDGFPTFIAAVKAVQPKMWLFENVRGMLYRNRWYLDEVLEQLQASGYQVDLLVVNAKNFGVPQNRERVIAIGHQGGFVHPRESGNQISAGEALGELATSAPPESRFLTPSMDAYVAKYEAASKCVNPRDLNLERPARTLTCRNLAGATGDMHRIKLADGRRRRLMVREAARLQSFPDWFQFAGREDSQLTQIGNAVPPLLARRLAESVRKYLEGDRGESSKQDSLFSS